MIYQIEETQSECPHCSGHKKQPLRSRSSSGSPKKQKRIIIPIKSHRNKTDTMLDFLQKQIKELKVDNQEKEKKIKKLQNSLRINRLSPLSFDSPKAGEIYDSYGQNQNIFRNRTKKFGSHYEDEHQPLKSDRKKVYFTQSLPIEEVNRKIQQLTLTKNNEINFLEKQLKKQQQMMEQLSERLQEQISDNQWLTKFCLSFVQLTGQISKSEGIDFVDPGASLRKNAKSAWRFLKQFINNIQQ